MARGFDPTDQEADTQLAKNNYGGPVTLRTHSGYELAMLLYEAGLDETICPVKVSAGDRSKP